MLTTRRTFLKALSATAAAMFLPFGRRADAHLGMPAGVSSPPVIPFKDPLKLPVTLKGRRRGSTTYYNLEMKQATAQFHADMQPTQILGYNGLMPAPIIRASKNRKVIVRQVNNLPMSGGMGSHSSLPAVHLHGAHVAPEDDGHPDDGIPHGQYRDYIYPNKQRGCLLWFHDHAHTKTGDNVYQGLAGLYLLRDPLEAALRLPSGKCEVPLVIQDRLFRNNWSFDYAANENNREVGMLGDIYLVNGVAFPYFQVEARKYRFRILNGSNSRLYGLALSDGSELIQIGTDGGLLQRPNRVAGIDIWPSERLDIVIDFSRYAVGQSVMLRNSYEIDEMAYIMRFDVVKKVRDSSKVPEFLAPFEEIPESQSVMTRVFNLNRTTIDNELVWTINGQAYQSNNPPLASPKLNTIEKWRFVNPTNHPHPIHLHLVQFQVVNINGAPVDPAKYGWKDTLIVMPGGEITILMHFIGYTGRYVFHCHNLEHEDYAMMGEFEVVP